MRRIIFPFLLVGLALLVTGCGTSTTANTNAAPTNTNSVVNTNAASLTNDTDNQETTLRGRVFIKGYKTPSESYGILATGREIGMDQYDARKEQLRPYVGDDIDVTFTSICKASTAGCCRTIFAYCGTVKDWKPVSAKNQ